MITLPPFKSFLASNIPSVYDNTLSYYDELTKLIAYLEQVVVPTVNEATAQIDGLQKSFDILKSYVDNYFDNLDVQEEINNKLDEMAESGELAGIIAQFLELAPVFGYKTINDMANADNLSNGCIARVLGNTSASDGDGAYYTIRTREESDDPDGYSLVAIGATLVGERILDAAFNQLINSEPINVKFHGVYGDGTHDDTTAIQALIDNNPYKTLYFPYGTYLISAPLKIKSGNEYAVDLMMSGNATIKTDTVISSLIEIGDNSTGTWSRYTKGSIVTISGGVLDATNTTQAIKILSNRKQTVIKDITIINVSNYGIYTDTGLDASSSTDSVFDNLSINGNTLAQSSVGIYLNANDDKLTHIRINGCKTAIYLAKAGHVLEDIHPLGSFTSNTPSKEEYELTTGIVFHGNGSYILTDIYLDTMAHGMVFDNVNLTIMVNNLYFFWWVKNATYETKLFEQNGVGNSRFFINNTDIELPTEGTFTGIDLSNTNSNYRTYFPSYEQYQLHDVKIANYAKLDIKDWLYCRAIHTEDSVILTDAWSTTMTANSYYPIAVVRSGLANIRIQAGNDQIIDATINPANNLLVVNNVANNAQTNVYSLALCNSSTDSDGTAYSYLCVKATTGRPLNIALSNLKGWNQQIFARRGYSTSPLSAPTVETEVSFNPN